MITNLLTQTTVHKSVLIRGLHGRRLFLKQKIATEKSFHTLSKCGGSQHCRRKPCHEQFSTNYHNQLSSFCCEHIKKSYSGLCYVEKVAQNGQSNLRHQSVPMCTSPTSDIKHKGLRGPRKSALVARSKLGALHGISVTGTSVKERNKELALNYDDPQDLEESIEVTETILSSEELHEKYDFLKEKLPSDVEHVIDVNYGFVRVDKHNRPGESPEKFGSQLSQNENAIATDKRHSGSVLSKDLDDNASSFVDENCGLNSGESVFEQYSGFVKSSDEDYFRNFLGATQTKNAVVDTIGSNAFEEQYFGSQEEVNETKPEIAEDKEAADNYFDEQYFTHVQHETITGNSPQHSMNSLSSLHEIPIEHDFAEGNDKLSNLSKSVSDDDNFFDQQYLSSKTSPPEEAVEHVKRSEPEPIIATDFDKKPKHKVKPNIDHPSTAFDMAMKIRLEQKGKLQDKSVSSQVSRKWQGEVDSHGFRILRDQVLDIHNLPESTVLSILHDSIVYDDDNITAINKPYGLPSHGGPGVHNSVGKFIEPLAEKVSGKPRSLHLVHRLDKETTGVMVLAKSENVALDLRKRFKKREVLKKYLVITKGIPKPTQGMIDIPLTETKIHDKYRMILAPNYNQDTKLLMKRPRDVHKFPAVTYYRVLDSNYSAALIECQPDSGVKHQIRCHLAFGLNTPILGDHKYSHFSKTAPQKLFPEMLQRLGIRQSKVRYIPMHLHASSLILPEFRDGRNLFLSAKLPKHFLQNMKWLKLKMPS